MNWHIVFISITYFAIFHIEIDQATKISCSENQICVHYKKCRTAVKIAAKILSSSNNEEKETLSADFKTLRCGNFSSEKTVCCNQDQIQIPKTSKYFI